MSQWDDAAKKLTQLTRSGDLKWKGVDVKLSFPSRPYSRFTRQYVYGLAYFTRYLDKHIAVYETEFPNMHEDETPYYDYSVSVEFVTPEGEPELEWRFDDLSAAGRDLLQAVRFQVSGAGDFLGQLLKDYKPDPKDE